MATNNLISNLYSSALPSVRDQPLQTMPRSLYAYVYKVSHKQQVPLCLLTLLVFPLTLVPLELQRRIVDDAIASADLQRLILLGALYLTIVLGQGGLKYARNVYMNRVAEGVTRILRRRVAHSDSFDAASDEGTKQSIMSSEAENLGGFVAESVAFPLLQAGIVLSIAGYMLFVEPLIAAVAISFLVPSMIVMAVSQPVLNRLSEKKITAARNLGECILKDSRDKTRARPDPDGFIEHIYELRLRFASIKEAAKQSNNLINHIGPLSVLMVGGWLVIQGQTEVGTIVAFMSGYERMTNPTRDLLNFYRRLAVMRVQYCLVYEAGQG